MIIGLSGQARAGKDTVADFLVKNHGFVKIAFADEIKRICMRLWDFSEEQLWGDLKEEPDERYPLKQRLLKGYYPEEINSGEYLIPRHAMQQIGTEVARAIDPDVWVRFGMNVAKQLLEPIETKLVHEGWRVYDRTKGITEFYDMKPIEGVVICDCRFENEFVAVKAEGELDRVVRETVLTGAANAHKSESEQREFPDSYFRNVIQNNGTLDELEAVAATLVL